MFTYHPLSLPDLPSRLTEIDVSEKGTVVYYWVEGEIQAVPEEWERPKWTNDAWHQESWTTVLGRKGVKAWGALDGERLVGIAVYRPHLTEDTAQLAALFVSNKYRRQGIASQLTAQVEQQTRSDGYAALYVSATPSESAVNFYRAQGFVPTQQTNPELYALEPEDIHMIKELNPSGVMRTKLGHR